MSHAILLALLLAAPATAQDDPAQPPILVVGQRIQDFRDALAACLARNCPTDEDADATLALAEALFLNGDYAEGRNIVQASLRRNRGNARNFPEPVSDLYRAHARLSHHLGLDDDARRSTYGILNALQAGLPQEDYRHFTARLEISEMQMQQGNIIAGRRIGVARRELQQLARVARAAGREDVATVAELRILWFELLDDAHGSARRRLVAMSRLTGPGDRMRATGAKLLLARLYRREGETERANALLAEVGRTDSTGARRRLLVSPPFELQVREIITPSEASAYEPESYVDVRNQVSDNFEDKWIDVGFWVMPDGRVSGLEILRHDNNPDWADPLMASIRGRVYSQGPEATYRLERYSYTASYMQVTGSNIRHRSRAARVEYLDLTTGNERPGPPPTAEN